MVGVFLTWRGKNLFKGWTSIKEYILKDKINQYQNLYELNKNNKLEDNTTIYLTSLSEFPSYKLKNYIEENTLNIKTARKLDKIDALIINHDFISSSYTSLEQFSPYYIIPSEVILENPLFQKYINNINDWMRIDEIGKEKITHYFISLKEYQNCINIDANFSLIKEYPLIECLPISNSWGNKKVADNINFFFNIFDIIEQYNLKVIFDHNINNDVNEGLSIDEDIFENIINMITSEDESNLNLAKEIMANMEFESSKPYFIYLFNYFYKLKQNNSNNRNYNYLKRQMKKYTHTSSTKHNPTIFDYFLPILIEKHPEYSQDFMNCFKVHINLLFKKNVIKEIQTY
jgi:hypothetical protein